MCTADGACRSVTSGIIVSIDRASTTQCRRITVPKRLYKRAVDRNYIKRRLRIVAQQYEASEGGKAHITVRQWVDLACVRSMIKNT